MVSNVTVRNPCALLVVGGCMLFVRAGKQECSVTFLARCKKKLI